MRSYISSLFLLLAEVLALWYQRGVVADRAANPHASLEHQSPKSSRSLFGCLA